MKNIIGKEMTPAQKEWSKKYRHTLNKIGRGLIIDCNGGNTMKYPSDKRLSQSVFQQTMRQEMSLKKTEIQY